MSLTLTELRRLLIDHTADASNADVRRANQDASRSSLPWLIDLTLLHAVAAPVNGDQCRLTY